MNPSSEEEPISVFMRLSAANFIEEVSENFDHELDFSEQSIETVQKVIAANSVPEDFDPETWGSLIAAYLGETCIRNLGGAWVTHPEYEFLVQIGSDSNYFLADHWILECMEDPETNSIAEYYLDAKKTVTGEDSPTLGSTPKLLDDESPEAAQEDHSGFHFMDNSLHMEQLTPDEISELAADPEKLSGLVFSNSDDWAGTNRIAMSNHNGWHTIHYLLTGDVWGGIWPLNFMAALDVGSPVSYSEESPPAKLFDPSETKLISNALQSIPPDLLAKHFKADDDQLSETGCGLDAFGSAEEYLNDSMIPDYEEIRDFVADAASNGRGLLVAWNMM